MSSMLKPPKQASRRQELREDTVTTAYVRTMTFAEEHRSKLIAAAVAVVVLILALVGYMYWRSVQNGKAEEALGAILPVYEEGQYEQALDGTADAPGLLEIVDEYGSTEAGNLARFYTATALFELGRVDEAGRHFAAFDGGNDILGASALAGEAAAAELAGDHARAARLYERAASAYPSPATAPDFLMAAGRNHEAAGNVNAARQAYERIARDYEETQQATLVPALVARLEAAGR